MRLSITSVVLAGCYDVPKPDCGFRCGPSAACPSDYTCGPDNHCHLNGSSPSMICATPDAMPDAYSPSVTLAQPMPGMQLNPANPVIVRFDVNVTNVNTGTFTVNATGSSLFVVGDVSYDPSTRTALFARTGGLPAGTALTATLTDAIINPITNLPLRTTSFDFETGPDVTGPMLISSTTADGQVDISVSANVTALFTEAIFNVSTSTFFVSAGGSIPGVVTSNGAMAIFDPTNQLEPNTLYTVTLTGMRDAANNPTSPQSIVLDFTTGADNVPPSVRSTSPMNMSTNVAVGSNIVVTFDESMSNVNTTTFQVNGGAITGNLTTPLGSRVWTFDPDSDLPAASTINVTLSNAITDSSGNQLSPFAFSFTTN